MTMTMSAVAAARRKTMTMTMTMTMTKHQPQAKELLRTTTYHLSASQSRLQLHAQALKKQLMLPRC